MTSTTSLAIENFGPLRRVDVRLADITVLVGPQATGKSLVLQWLKLAIDRNRVLGTLAKYGFDVKGSQELLLGWTFGASYRDSVGRNTAIRFQGKPVDIARLARGRKRNEEHHALVVPAHRALVFGTGFPLAFRGFDDETPFVVKDFSERVRDGSPRNPLPELAGLRAPRLGNSTAAANADGKGTSAVQVRAVAGRTPRWSEPTSLGSTGP